MAGNGEMAVIFVMPATTATMQKAATTEITGTTGTGAIAVTTVITGARGQHPTVKTATGQQVVVSLTVRPVPPTATARSVMTAMVRVVGLRARRAMTGRAARTVRIGPTVQTAQIGQIVQTGRIVMAGRIGMAVRTGRTETAVVIRTVALVVGEMEARVVAPVVAPAVIRITAVTAARTNALALTAASPNGPEIPLTVPHLRQWCGF